ncbi:MAG: DUF1830 domain-containing protein [Okeania sp. SIO2C9]|uniref:DUF1830 domain-containing protein n=1 Tax=Okeania sp. SIO2C9 TaxID=2607791 RepID=UPI0013C220E5|nr:DUF1830 domain-containing protein [Okeania sp. SIO2C9]NEQ73040.1 DUF1830 domain-containing protein [Okeania sp. SIO2C9]
MAKKTEDSKTIKCLYINCTERIAILKIDFMGQWLERAVEAGKEYLFETNEDAYLEIYTSEISTMILSDRVACSQLVLSKYTAEIGQC